jgi:integrase
LGLALAAELATATSGKHPDELVFSVPNDSVVQQSNWRRAVFLPARARAGLSDRFRVHDLRHTAASLRIQAGYPPKMLQEILGHSSITTTLDLYGHLYPGEMDRYAARLNDAAGRLMLPKCGQTTKTLTPTRRAQRLDLRRVWRARRDSNPQPSDP